MGPKADHAEVTTCCCDWPKVRPLRSRRFVETKQAFSENERKTIKLSKSENERFVETKPSETSYNNNERAVAGDRFTETKRSFHEKVSKP